MTEEKTNTDSASKPEEIFSPGAIAHYMHCAHILMHKYYKAKTRKDITSETTAPAQVYSFLEKLDHEYYTIGQIADPQEQSSALGDFTKKHLKMAVDALACAYVFARVVNKLDATIPAGEEGQLSSDPELTKASLEKVATGLKASLGRLGEVMASVNPQAIPRLPGYFEASVSVTSTGRLASAPLRNRFLSGFSQTMRHITGLKSLNMFEINNPFLSEAMGTFTAGYHQDKSPQPLGGGRGR